MTDRILTADKLRDLAAAAEGFASAVQSAHESLLTTSGSNGDRNPIRAHAFRLPDVAEQMRQAAEDLRATVNDSDRISAIPAEACRLPWGVCPEHGASLVSSGGRTQCRTCRRSWNYDRLAMPCRETVRWLLADQSGTTRHVCDGHATAARRQLVGARLSLLSDGRASDDHA